MDRVVSIAENFIGTASLVNFVGFYLTNYSIYGRLFSDYPFLAILLLQFAWYHWIGTKKEVRFYKFYIVNIAILITIPVFIMINIPKFTYNQAKQIIIEDRLISKVRTIKHRGNEFNLQYDRTIQESLKNKGYLIEFVEDGKKTSYLFNPYIGQYKQITIIE